MPIRQGFVDILAWKCRPISSRVANDFVTFNHGVEGSSPSALTKKPLNINGFWNWRRGTVPTKPVMGTVWVQMGRVWEGLVRLLFATGPVPVGTGTVVGTAP